VVRHATMLAHLGPIGSNAERDTDITFRTSASPIVRLSHAGMLRVKMNESLIKHSSFITKTRLA